MTASHSQLTIFEKQDHNFYVSRKEKRHDDLPEPISQHEVDPIPHEWWKNIQGKWQIDLSLMSHKLAGTEGRGRIAGHDIIQRRSKYAKFRSWKSKSITESNEEVPNLSSGCSQN